MPGSVDTACSENDRPRSDRESSKPEFRMVRGFRLALRAFDWQLLWKLFEHIRAFKCLLKKAYCTSTSYIGSPFFNLEQPTMETISPKNPRPFNG